MGKLFIGDTVKIASRMLPCILSDDRKRSIDQVVDRQAALLQPDIKNFL